MDREKRKNKYHYYGSSHQPRHFWLILVVSILLCSCQKTPETKIQIKTSNVYNVADELEVETRDYQNALQRSQERLSQVQEDSIEAADIYSIIGGIYAEYVKDREQSLFYIKKAIEIHQRENDEMGLAGDYNDMSKIYIYIGGEIKEGLEYLEKAEQIYKKNGYVDSFGLAGTFINKGHLYKKNGQYEEALGACMEAQGIYKKRQENNATLHLLTGQAYLEMQEYELAEEQYFEAQQICEIENNQYRMAVVKFQLGDLYLNKMDYNQAIEVYNQALEFYLSDEAYLSDTAFTYSSLAYTYNHSGNLTNALETGVYACRIIEKIKSLSDEMEEDKKIYKHNLSRYYEKWSKDMSEEGYETWYQDIVMEGNEWRTGDE